MAEFTVNPTRFDPYKSHMFRVKWDGVYVAGLSKMSPLKLTTASVTHRVGGDPATSARARGSRRTTRSPSSAGSPTTRPSRRGPTR